MIATILILHGGTYIEKWHLGGHISWWTGTWYHDFGFWAKKKWRIHYSSLFETELSAETGVCRNRMASIQSQSIFEKITLQKPVAIWTKFLPLVKNVIHKSWNFALSEKPHEFLCLFYLKNVANFKFFVPTVAGTFVLKTIKHFITKDVFCFFSIE